MICTMYAPWFGPLPFYTANFIDSCARSPEILWIVHSDQESPIVPVNVVWVKCHNLSGLIALSLPVPVPIRNWGHKLCDLKPYWHDIFAIRNGPSTEYRGWCDWDVVHNLSSIVFDFNSAKFTKHGMCSPLFIQRADIAIEWFPKDFQKLLNTKESVSWDEAYYLRLFNSTILQPGLTPEVCLTSPARYAVHMCRAKHHPSLFSDWLKLYCRDITHA